MVDLDSLLSQKFPKGWIKVTAVQWFQPLTVKNSCGKLSTIELHLYASDLWGHESPYTTLRPLPPPVVKRNGSAGSGNDDVFQRRIDHYGGIVIRKQTGIYLAKDPL